MNAPPRRVRVTSPRTSGARTRRVVPTSEIDGRTRLGEVYVSSLLRAQLRLALGVMTVVAALGLVLPMVFFLAPELSEIEVVGMPLPWALLAVAAYPFLLLCGWAYVRRAERNERVFATIVDPRPPHEDGM